MFRKTNEGKPQRKKRMKLIYEERIEEFLKQMPSMDIEPIYPSEVENIMQGKIAGINVVGGDTTKPEDMDDYKETRIIVNPIGLANIDDAEESIGALEINIYKPKSYDNYIEFVVKDTKEKKNISLGRYYITKQNIFGVTVLAMRKYGETKVYYFNAECFTDSKHPARMLISGIVGCLATKCNNNWCDVLGDREDGINLFSFQGNPLNDYLKKENISRQYYDIISKSYSNLLDANGVLLYGFSVLQLDEIEIENLIDYAIRMYKQQGETKYLFSIEYQWDTLLDANFLDANAICKLNRVKKLYTFKLAAEKIKL